MSDLPPPPPNWGQSSPGPATLAEWPLRAGAFVADLVIFGVVSFIVGVPARSVGTGAVIAGGVIVSALYFILQEGNSGQTVGKRMWSLRVVGEDGGAISYSTAAVRWVVKYLVFQIMTLLLGFFAIAWVLADYLWPLRDERNQTLHDKAARTIVVVEPREEQQ
ncbi:MAG: RDD family protein [Acidimicrobiales bacterium]